MRTGTAPCALYRFFDAEDQLLYVGITKSVPARTTEHARAAWSQQATRVTLQWFPSPEQAHAAEVLAIRTEDPKYNIRDRFPARRQRQPRRLSEPPAWPPQLTDRQKGQLAWLQS